MVQWVKNLAAVAQVPEEVQVQSLVYEVSHAQGVAKKMKNE